MTQGEGIINPRHSCGDQVCCIHPHQQISNLQGCGRRNPIVGLYRSNKRRFIDNSNSNNCKYSLFTELRIISRITAISNTLPGEFPWMVAILEKSDAGNKFVCGGKTIINRNSSSLLLTITVSRISD